MMPTYIQMMPAMATTSRGTPKVMNENAAKRIPPTTITSNVRARVSLAANSLGASLSDI